MTRARTPQEDALNALAIARKLLEESEPWVMEIQGNYLEHLLEYIDDKVRQIQAVQRVRRPKGKGDESAGEKAWGDTR